MKKFNLVICGLLGVLLISGCSFFGGSDSDQTTSGSESSPSGQPEQSESASSDSGSQSGGESSDPDSGSESASESSAAETDTLAAIRSKLQGQDDLLLPRSVPVAEGKHLSALVETSEDGYSLTFKQTDDPVKLNDTSLKDADTVASLKAVTYADEAEAEKQISYHKYTSSDGSPVDLGSDITGYSDAGAGTAGISWNEGRWTLSALSPTSDAEAGKSLAKKVVAFLEKNTLPAPQPHGTVHVYTDSRKDTISWQNGKTIYTLTDTSDPTTLLSIAASVK